MTEPVADARTFGLTGGKQISRTLGDAQTGVPVNDQIALSDAEIRRKVAYWIMALFGAVTLMTLFFVYLLFQADQRDLAAKLMAPGDRIVNAEVLISLLGATTVQLGTVVVIMARFVFKT